MHIVCVVHVCFDTAMAELSSCNRHCRGFKAEDIYSLSLSLQKILGTPDLQYSLILCCPFPPYNDDSNVHLFHKKCAYCVLKMGHHHLPKQAFLLNNQNP